jgi:hypothetical protein
MDTWAIVELMGHVRLAGRLTEEEKFGSKMGRLDIPTTEPCSCANGAVISIEAPRLPCERCHGAGFVNGFVTQYFGGGSVYRITFVTEAVARHVASQASVAPVSTWDFPKQLPASLPPEADRVMSRENTPEDCDYEPDEEDWR